MNWKKGLFRIWLVISVIWIVVVGFLSRPDFWYQRYSQFRSDYLSVSENERNVDTSICKQFDLRPWQKYADEPLTFSSPKQPIEIMLACTKHLKSEKSDKDHSKILLANMGWSAKDFVEYGAKLGEMNLAYRELKASIIWLTIPPFVLLALGMAVAWAIAGFQRKP